MRVWTDRTPLTLHIAAGSPAALAVCGNRFANAAQEPGGCLRCGSWAAPAQRCSLCPRAR